MFKHQPQMQEESRPPAMGMLCNFFLLKMCFWGVQISLKQLINSSYLIPRNHSVGPRGQHPHPLVKKKVTKNKADVKVKRRIQPRV